jgi:hypothetical protein
MIAMRTLHEFPRERVLAPAAADQENLHLAGLGGVGALLG